MISSLGHHVDDLVPDCSISIANTLEILVTAVLHLVMNLLYDSSEQTQYERMYREENDHRCFGKHKVKIQNLRNYQK